MASELPRGLAPRPGESPITITIALSGETDIARQLRALDSRAGDLSPAWPTVDAVFESVEAAQFASEGAHGGEPWPDLAARTQRERQRLGFPPAHPILQRTQRLSRSLTGSTPDTISVHGPLTYLRGTLVPYYVYHQSLEPRTRLPRRAPVQFTADDKHALLRPIRVHLRGGTPGAAHTGAVATATGGR